MTDWQPIESAPRIACPHWWHYSHRLPDGRDVMICHWCRMAHIARYWTDSNSQPLPEPPAE